jgi:hypothetical protein
MTQQRNDTIVRVDMKFIGGNADQRIRALNERAEYSSFFLGHIPEGRSHVLNYDNLASLNVWNNVDIIYGSNLGGLKYYFICKPAGGGGSYANIDLKYNGADSVKIDGSGQLQSMITTSGKRKRLQEHANGFYGVNGAMVFLSVINTKGKRMHNQKLYWMKSMPR